jgi:hypothetical protein
MSFKFLKTNSQFLKTNSQFLETGLQTPLPSFLETSF